jgi:hypothetical protein
LTEPSVWPFAPRMKETNIPPHAVDDPKPKVRKAVRVWLADGTRILGMWTGTRWWSSKGEIAPVKWELEERRKKTKKLRKLLKDSGA